MNNLVLDPVAIAYAILAGAVPAVLWLLFWIKAEDDVKGKTRILIIFSFLLGGAILFFAIYFEKMVPSYVQNQMWQTIIYSSIEEILKFIGISIIVFGSGIMYEPIDYVIYAIALALGFSAFENTLFLIDPFTFSNSITALMTGGLRFLGGTILHPMASVMTGSALGLSFYLPKRRFAYMIVGLICAATLHSIFNLLVLNKTGGSIFIVFGFLWIIAIINIFIFEKLKKSSSLIPSYNEEYINQKDKIKEAKLKTAL